MKLETIEALFKALNEENVRLIVLKRKAGRTRDLDDIEKLENLKQERDGD